MNKTENSMNVAIAQSAIDIMTPAQLRSTSEYISNKLLEMAINHEENIKRAIAAAILGGFEVNFWRPDTNDYFQINDIGDYRCDVN